MLEITKIFGRLSTEAQIEQTLDAADTDPLAWNVSPPCEERSEPGFQGLWAGARHAPALCAPVRALVIMTSFSRDEN